MYQVRDTLLKLVKPPYKVAGIKGGRKRLCPIQRLLNRVQGDLCDNQCWLVDSNLDPDGYVQIYTDNKNKRGHRILWSAYYNQPLIAIPEGKQLNHTCDNSNCINPTHLYIGTQKQNVEDIKYRSLRFRGTGAILNEQSVKTIKQRLLAGETSTSISKDFGVSSSTIRKIKCGKNWGWVKST